MIKIFSEAEESLLRAALLDQETALEAFAKWRVLTDFEGKHEASQFCMLPLLHANMARLGLNDPVMSRLRGVHRHAWAEGQRRLHAAAIVVQLLAVEGIPALFTTGPALVQDYYPVPSPRPIHDVNVLVSRNQIDAAIDCLARAGWQLIDPQPRYIAGGVEQAALMVWRDGVTLVDSKTNQVNLHWNLVHACTNKLISKWFWSDVELMTVLGVRALRPGPGPLLFHVICDGFRPNAMTSLRWVADAAMILEKRGNQIDWDKFWEVARHARLVMRLEQGLATVQRMTGLELPQGAKNRAAQGSPVEWLETVAWKRTKHGEKSNLAPWIWRVATVLRIWHGGDKRLILRVISQWLRISRS